MRRAGSVLARLQPGASSVLYDKCVTILYRCGFFLVAAIEAAIQLFLSLGHRPGPKVDMVQKNPH